jgi:hypothetical protein
MTGRKCKLFLVREQRRVGDAEPTKVRRQIGEVFPDWESLQAGWLNYCKEHGGFDAVAHRSKGIQVLFVG